MDHYQFNNKQSHQEAILLDCKGPSTYYLHCKYCNAKFECNDIVIFIYSHYPLNPNAKSSDTKGKTFSII